MPGLSHRVVLVGVAPELQSPVRAALRQRNADIAAVAGSASAAAEEALANPEVAHLFVGQLEASALAALSSAVPGQPILALLPTGAGVAQVVEAQRAGAAQVVPLPFSADDFLRALDGISLLFPPAERDARVIAVCGVSGGCGATTLALNLAWELSRSCPSRPGCLLVELARRMGTLATYLDLEPPRTTHDLLSDPTRLTTHGVRQAMASAGGSLDVIVGPYQEITPVAVQSRHVHQLIAVCRRLAPVVVLDVPCAFDDLQFETLALAEQVVLVGAQTVASVRTMKLLRDTLEREEGIAGMRLVINRYEPSLPGFSAERLTELLGVPVLTVANDYPSVMSAVNNGKPVGVAMPHSPVVADVRALARALSGAPTAAPPSTDRLARALGRKEPTPRVVRVLHIEDDAVQQQAMRLHLAAMKDFTFHVTPAVSEAEAVAAFTRQPFDVVLLDYHLAQGNGLGCLRQLRTLDAMVPVVVISGVAQPQVAAELLDAGADDFVSKENVSGQTLVRTLSAAVARSDAIRGRLRDDAFLDRVRRTLGAGDEHALLESLHELHQSAGQHRLSAGQIQRLVDLVCGEMDRTAPAGQATPRKALLGLFMRLFGGQA